MPRHVSIGVSEQKWDRLDRLSQSSQSCRTSEIWTRKHGRQLLFRKDVICPTRWGDQWMSCSWLSKASHIRTQHICPVLESRSGAMWSTIVCLVFAFVLQCKHLKYLKKNTPSTMHAITVSKPQGIPHDIEQQHTWCYQTRQVMRSTHEVAGNSFAGIQHSDQESQYWMKSGPVYSSSTSWQEATQDDKKACLYRILEDLCRIFCIWCYTDLYLLKPCLCTTWNLIIYHLALSSTLLRTASVSFDKPKLSLAMRLKMLTVSIQQQTAKAAIVYIMPAIKGNQLPGYEAMFSSGVTKVSH